MEDGDEIAGSMKQDRLLAITERKLSTVWQQQISCGDIQEQGMAVSI
jgi:hypothetical protein